MVEFFKGLYEAIINIFKDNVDSGSEGESIFNTIKKLFDDFFAGKTEG